MSEFVVLHAWIVLQPLNSTPPPLCSLSASFLPSIHPSFSKWTPWMLEWELHCGREEHTQMFWLMSGHVAAECMSCCCVCVFVFLLGDALSSALFHSHPGWKSLLASSLRPYY